MSDTINVDYSTRIPNNVGLTEDRTVLRAGRAIDTTLPDYRELDDLVMARPVVA